MAYSYTPLTYAPNYYTQAQAPYIAAQMANAVQPSIAPSVVQNTPTSANNGLIWVQGETGAKSYLVAPNNTILLMDSEAQQFFLKSADASGMPLPLRTFTYKEVIAQNTQNTAQEAVPAIDLDKYVTREEFDKKFAELAQKKTAKKTEVKEDE